MSNDLFDRARDAYEQDEAERGSLRAEAVAQRQRILVDRWRNVLGNTSPSDWTVNLHSSFGDGEYITINGVKFTQGGRWMNGWTDHYLTIDGSYTYIRNLVALGRALREAGHV